MKLTESKIILLAQVLSGILSFTAVSLTASYVGASNFAFCSIALLLVNLGTFLIDFGSCSWAARELASDSMTSHTYELIMNSKSKLNIGFITLVPLSASYLPVENRYVLILVIYPLLSNRNNFIQHYLVAKNRIALASLLMVSDRLCWLVIIPLMRFKFDKTLSFCLPIIMGLSIYNFFGSKILQKDSRADRTSIKYSQIKLFKMSRHFGLSGLSGLSNLIDGFFVAMFTSASESGKYLLAQRYRNPSSIIFSSVAIRLRSLAASQDRHILTQALLAERGVLTFGVVTNCIFACFLNFFSERILGQSFQKIGIIMFVGTLSAIPYGINLLCSALLNSLGKEKSVSILNITISIFLFTSMGFASHFEGAIGGVLTYFFINSFLALIHIQFLKKEIKLQLFQQNKPEIPIKYWN